MPITESAHNKAVCEWSFFKVDQERKIIFITDDGGARSVTNTAEEVCRDVFARMIGNDWRLFYMDTDGHWDEMLHDNGKFIEFAPGGRIRP